MATGLSTRHVSVSSSTPNSRNNEKVFHFNAYDQTKSASSITTAGVPVKFADNLFSVVRNETRVFLRKSRFVLLLAGQRSNQLSARSSSNQRLALHRRECSENSYL